MVAGPPLVSQLVYPSCGLGGREARMIIIIILRLTTRLLIVRTVLRTYTPENHSTVVQQQLCVHQPLTDQPFWRGGEKATSSLSSQTLSSLPLPLPSLSLPLPPPPSLQHPTSHSTNPPSRPLALLSSSPLPSLLSTPIPISRPPSPLSTCAQGLTLGRNRAGPGPEPEHTTLVSLRTD